MTVRGTLGLLVLLALLVVYLAVVDAPSPESAAFEEPLLTTPATQVTAVAIEWPDRRLMAVRRAHEWRAEDQRLLPSGMIDDLLAALATVRPMGTVTPGKAGETDYGFGPGMTSLTVSAGEGPLLRLEVGARNPAWTGVYVRRAENPHVLVVGALLHWELEKLRTAASRRT